VQHKLHENSSYVWHLIHDLGGYFYVCGYGIIYHIIVIFFFMRQKGLITKYKLIFIYSDAKSMARDVNTALIQVAQSYGGMDETSATNYIKDLRSKGRYQEDVWS
jgi:NADPH-ferrihemoprotein reductase